jgi:hypothetical protein
MVKTKNPTPSIELRLSINLSLDDVGMERLYLELNAIEKGASGLAPIQIHALKRRHLLKILHSYCADVIAPAPRNTDAHSANLNQNPATAGKVGLTKATQSTSLPVVEAIRQEHPPPTTISAFEADRALLDSGFGFQKEA